MSTQTDYLYVASADGDEGKSPCKIGISMDLGNRIHGIRSSSPIEKDVEYTAIYTCAVSPRVVEADYHNQLSGHRLDNEEEWFEITPEDAIAELENDDRCERADINSVLGFGKGQGEDTISSTPDDELVQLNVKARKWVRKKLGHKMVEEEKALQDVVDEALRLYVQDD